MKIMMIIFSLFLSSSVFANLNFIKKSGVQIKEPLKLRDPFKRDARSMIKSGQSRGRILIDNKFSNLPKIDNVSLESIRIVGILLGKNRRAIARVVDDTGTAGKETYIVKEGMKLGENGAAVKAIVPGGIILAEKIRNVYEEDEYIETVIPITAPSVGDR